MSEAKNDGGDALTVASLQLSAAALPVRTVALRRFFVASDAQ